MLEDNTLQRNCEFTRSLKYNKTGKNKSKENDFKINRHKNVRKYRDDIRCFEQQRLKNREDEKNVPENDVMRRSDKLCFGSDSETHNRFKKNESNNKNLTTKQSDHRGVKTRFKRMLVDLENRSITSQNIVYCILNSLLSKSQAFMNIINLLLEFILMSLLMLLLGFVTKMFIVKNKFVDLLLRKMGKMEVIVPSINHSDSKINVKKVLRFNFKFHNLLLRLSNVVIKFINLIVFSIIKVHIKFSEIACVILKYLSVISYANIERNLIYVCSIIPRSVFSPNSFKNLNFECKCVLQDKLFNSSLWVSGGNVLKTFLDISSHIHRKLITQILNYVKRKSCDQTMYLKSFYSIVNTCMNAIKLVSRFYIAERFKMNHYRSQLSRIESGITSRSKLSVGSIILLLLIICCQVQASPEASALRHDEDEEVLHIGGIFPINGEGGWQGGQACMPAAYLALEDVNKRKDLLPGFQLRLHSNDSECEPGLGASVMYNLLYNPPQKLLLLAGCSTVCTTVAEAAKMWNLMVLCYGASSPALSDRGRFPTLFRTHPSATVHNPTRIRLMKKFGWSRVAILQQAEEVFISTVEDLEARCKEANIEIVTRQSFLSDPGDAVRNLRRQDARIIVGLFYVVAARRVLCDLYKQNLYGKSYVWFFIGWYEDNWFEVNLEKEGIECTAEQMRTAAEGHLTTEALMWNQNHHQPTISGMTAEDFQLRLNAVLREEGYDIDKNRYPEGYQEAPLAYDAVWAVALALNKTMERLSRSGRGISLKNFTYTDKEIADDIYAAINSTSFLGVSGNVAFSSQGDRIALTQIEQMIAGEYVKLGYYDTQADNLTWLNKEKWAGVKVPQDRTIIRTELRLVSLPLYACISAVALAGICVTIGLIVFNIWNNHRRVIQSSHPVCNTIMLIGCALCLASLLVLGADGRVVSPAGFPALCQARLWLLSLGFTLAYGAMFSKVWRVHRFTTKAKIDPKKKVEPWKLYTMVSGLLLIDTVMLLSWQLKDPLLRKLEQFPLEEPPSALDDSKIRPELEHCESEHNAIWFGAIYGYKGLVLVFGLFLAYETRSVKLRQINDSRYVGMSIYNVVVLCLITAPVSLVVASQQDANFAFVSLAVIFCCFLSMALIFVPKVIEVIRHPKDRAESKYNPDAGQSREDEEKYHKLLAENDQLQQLIAAKEEKIRSLKQKLSEKEGQGKTTIVSGVTNVQTTNIIKDGHNATITQDIEEEHI